MHRPPPLSLDTHRLYTRVTEAAGYTWRTRPRLEGATTGLAFAEPDPRRIVVCERAVLEVVSNLWWRSARPVPASARVIRFAEFQTTALAGVLAHELGHIDAFDRGDFRDGPGAEADADWFAGVILARLGMRVAPATLLFADLGCLGAFCEHPSPNERRIAVERGHADETKYSARSTWLGVG